MFMVQLKSNPKAATTITSHLLAINIDVFPYTCLKPKIKCSSGLNYFRCRVSAKIED